MPQTFTTPRNLCKLTSAALIAFLIVLAPTRAAAVTCNGDEVLCLDLTSAADAINSGGDVVGGGFNATGFLPANQGGIDWIFDTTVANFSTGRIEVDIEGLVPNASGGGKVSIFSLCGEPPFDNEYIGFQKMPFDYRDGHIFRYGMDDDGLADNWDAVVITGAGFNCYYSIADPAWQLAETHHLIATWSPTGITLDIDGFVCSSGGNGDSFNPAVARLVLGNRCQHYANQQPVARLRNLRVWATGSVPPPGPTCDPTIIAESLEPTSGEGERQLFRAVYSNCHGADAFRIVQLNVWDEVAAGVPALGAAYEGGLFHLGGDSCAPGEARRLASSYGGLDCSLSTVTSSGDTMTVEWALDFDANTFAGDHGVYFDAKGGPGDQEPRLGWIEMGRFVVQAESGTTGDAGPTPDSGSDPGADAGGPSSTGDNLLGGCGCSYDGSRPSRPSPTMLAGLILFGIVLRRRRTTSG